MSRRGKGTPSLPSPASGGGKGGGRREPPAGELVAAKAAAKVAEAAPVDGQKEPRRRRRGTVLEERIGYRFKDGALLDCALTHISALKGARNRAGSYQRLEFLGDHVLGLVISDVLFRAFPAAASARPSWPTSARR
jgi:ribonuclease-3